MKREILVFDGVGEIADFIAKTWKEIARSAIEKKGNFTVAVSGGRTPIKVYDRLSRSRLILPWEKTHIFLVDERFVPFDNPESNYGIIKKALLNNINTPSENIHPVPIEKTPSLSADKYEIELKRFFRLRENSMPVFDLIMLGIGKDGHTASLFSDDNGPCEENCMARAVCLNRLENERITITLPVINNARNIIFLVTGKDKSYIVKQVIEEKDVHLSASMVRPKGGRVFFLLDAEAAGFI